MCVALLTRNVEEGRWQDSGGRLCCRQLPKESVEVDTVPGVRPHMNGILATPAKG